MSQVAAPDNIHSFTAVRSREELGRAYLIVVSKISSSENAPKCGEGTSINDVMVLGGGVKDIVTEVPRP